MEKITDENWSNGGNSEPWRFIVEKQDEFKFDFPTFEEYCKLSDEQRENINKQKWEKMKQENQPNKPIDSGFSEFPNHPNTV